MVVKFRMLRLQEGGIGIVEECRLKLGLGVQVGRSFFTTMRGVQLDISLQCDRQKYFVVWLLGRSGKNMVINKKY